MQTFLPFEDFGVSASSLDTLRLGNQRNEAKALVKCIEQGPQTVYDELHAEWLYGPVNDVLLVHKMDKSDLFKWLSVRKTPWYNHPAAVMWRDHVYLLRFYGAVVCQCYMMRGCQDSLYDWFIGDHPDEVALAYAADDLPAWLGMEEFHRSHQSNLIRKNPEFYRNKFPGVPDNLPYLWPVKENGSWKLVEKGAK